MIDIDKFIDAQLAQWPAAADSYDALSRVQARQVGNARVQFNPARIVSTGAKVDAAAISNRACFLCSANRPEQQMGIDWEDYTVLVNPYPIFPRHLTIPAKEHTPQRIAGRVAHMARLAQELPGYTVFYNGPRCGASAPDHMHFQAGNSDFLPIWSAQLPMGQVRITASTPQEAQARFDEVYAALPQVAGGEPMMNVLCRYADGEYQLIVIPRKKHRPACYGTAEGQMLISPASVDLAGVFITPIEKDYQAITEDMLKDIYSEVCYTQHEVDNMLSGSAMPKLRVGIMEADTIEIKLHGPYQAIGCELAEELRFTLADTTGVVRLVPLSAESNAEVANVTIGVNFHWQRQEAQRFIGEIQVVPTATGLVLINVLGVEDYLASVISSEMSATSQLELLKAHAVISRSWVLAQIEGKKKKGDDAPSAMVNTPEEIVKWYDHDDHDLFDVCADDHCQRYQGITRMSTQAVLEAVNATAGEVLMSDGELCDARFSKCCGGIFEQFEYCWAPEHKSYLVARADTPTPTVFPDLTIEANAVKWIKESPEAFCNTTDKQVLQQVLNGYDQETADFYRWTVEYDAAAISELVRRKSGIDFGTITALEPLERGTSGRISRLRITGTKRTMVVGKELEIRRWLSETHLYSSAFVVETTASGFRLVGAGWGHGVGLCQIGAAMMAHRGYGYRQILQHYYPGSEIKKYATQ